VVWPRAALVLLGVAFFSACQDLGLDHLSFRCSSDDDCLEGRRCDRFALTCVAIKDAGGAATDAEPDDDAQPPVDAGPTADSGPVCSTATASVGRWTPIRDVGSLSYRIKPDAVWTGSEMVFWLSGAGGARYDPAADTWSPITTLGAPLATMDRFIRASAVWTGLEVLIWDFVPTSSSSGRYTPWSDSWRPMSHDGEPVAVCASLGQSTIWTGSEMIVWAGNASAAAARYDPVQDRWRPLSSVGAPAGRCYAATVWTGREMILWGGSSTLAEGGRYDPVTDTWRPISTIGAPIEPYPAGVWTGTEMIVFGLNSIGGRYRPDLDRWTATAPTLTSSTTPSFQAGLWTGTRALFFDGLRRRLWLYDPTCDRWALGSRVDSPPSTFNPAVGWTGTEMLVWGGLDSAGDGTGYRFVP
jgi:hypothetical protein